MKTNTLVKVARVAIVVSVVSNIYQMVNNIKVYTAIEKGVKELKEKEA